MGANPYLKDIEKHEKLYSAELGKHLTKILRAKDVQKKADALTNSSSAGKVPPKPILKVFETALDKALKSLPRKYGGLVILPKVTYEQKGTSWLATATAEATFKMVSVGGATYKVQPGDTLWDISKAKYGAGMYWPAIAAANPKLVKSRGNFILAGVKLHVPQIQVPAGACDIDVLKKASKPTPEAKKPAASVMYPTLEYDLEKGSSVTQVFKAPGMTIRVTTTLKGTIKAQKEGSIPGGFNLRTYEAELSNGMKPFQSSIKIKDFRVDSVTVASNVSGTTWKTSVSLTKKGTIKASMSPKPVSFKHKKIVYEGNVGMEIEFQLIPDRVKEPAPWYERAYDWVADKGEVIVGGAIIVGAGVLVGATLVEDVLTGGAGAVDDPVSFAAASAMFGRGLQMVQ